MIRKLLYLNILIIFLLSLFASSCAKKIPDLITLDSNDLIPESFSWIESKGYFLTGTLNPELFGYIYQIDTEGHVSRWTEYIDVLLGVRAVRQGSGKYSHLIYAVGGLRPENASAPNKGGVWIFDINTRKLVHYADMTGLAPSEHYYIDDMIIVSGKRKWAEESLNVKHEWNMTTASWGGVEDGTVIATDAHGSWGYEVSPKVYTRTIFSTKDFYAPSTSGGIGLNGIVQWPGKDYLIMVHQGTTPETNVLYKIYFDNPQNPIQVVLSGDTVHGDGMALGSANTLYMCENSIDTLAKIVTEDDWATAKVVETRTAIGPFTTAVTIIHSKIYVLTGVNGFIAPSTYYIERLKF